MAESRASSVLFSLKGLQQLEAERARPAATAEPAGCRSESGDSLDFSLCR